MRKSFTRAMATAAAAVLAAGPSGSVFAAIYKCMGEGNQPTYQDSPCPPGKELRNFDTDPADVSVIPFGAVPSITTAPVAPKAPKVQSANKADKKKDAAPAVDIAQRKFIVPGMSEGEVIAKIGQPDMTTAKGRKSLRWSYLPAAGDPQTITTVVFDFGKVIDVERKIVK
jgi:hypothetical protein